MMLDPNKPDPRAEARARARAIAKAGGLAAAMADGSAAEADRLHAVGGAGARPAEAGRRQVFRHLRPRLDRSRRRVARLRGGGRHPHRQLPQRGRDGACRHRAALAIRRRLRGGDLDRSRRFAGDGRFAGGGLERRRRLSYLRRRDDLRRRLQHAAGAEGGAEPVRPHDRGHGPVLCAAHAGSDPRCAAARRALRQPSVPRRAVLPAAAAEYPAGAADAQSGGAAGEAGVAEAGARR